MTRSFATEQSYYFEAPPERVFQALTDPKLLVKWFLSKATVEPKVGGRYSFDWLGGYHMVGRVMRFQDGKVVSYSWHDTLKSGEKANTTASFHLKKSRHGTLLKLRHSGFKDPNHFSECSSRWGYYLTNMKSVLDHGTDLRSRYDR